MCRNQKIIPVSVSLFLRYLLFSNLLRLWDTLYLFARSADPLSAKRDFSEIDHFVTQTFIAHYETSLKETMAISRLTAKATFGR
ncbi:MAG: hypothetical protein J6386_15865 [Candidatus Synoicihabitans palmerolidicus]|nr:hypothetical protein [Candidatus Synoicihabitans palmerolidicus]